MPSPKRSIFDTHPEIAAQLHPSKNADVDVAKIGPGSGKTLWWQCSEGHEWEAIVYNRVRQGCPYCSGRKADAKNSLEALFPDISAQWHPTKNGTWLPNDAKPGSGKKVWWKCSKNHEWDAVIQSRVRGAGCPYCLGRRATPERNFATAFPDQASQWHPTKNLERKPENFTPHSNERIWWQCAKGHEWESTIAHRAEGLGCPYCSGRYATPDYNLRSQFPNLVLEWHPTKNSDCSPEEFRPGSAKKVWWQCKHGHEWRTSISMRTLRGTNCPHCSHQTSPSQIRLFCELRSIFGNAIDRDQTEGLEKDVLVSALDASGATIKIAIEHDGGYYHEGKEDTDLQKNVRLRELGYEIFRVRQSPLQNIEKTDIIYSTPEVSLEDIQQLLVNISEIIDFSSAVKSEIEEYSQKDDFSDDAEYRKRVSYLPGPPPEESLEVLYPDIAAQWHPEKNEPLLPVHFIPGSTRKVWWVCDQGHEWEAKIRERAIQGSGCHFCPSAGGARKASKYDNLSISHPKVASEWDCLKNADNVPEDYLSSSGKKMWWLCNKGHSWEAAIYQRTSGNKGQGSGCPFCSGTMASAEDNLEIHYPKIAAQWHPKKNGDRKPSDYRAGSNKKVWWLCEKGHEWEAVIGSRVRNGCPYCGNRVATEKNNIGNQYPGLLAEWDWEKNGDLDPFKLVPGSSKKVWWICAVCGNNWQAVIRNRTGKNSRGTGSGCRKCSYPRRQKTSVG